MPEFLKESLVGALVDEFANLAALGDEVAPAEWDRLTSCPGWTVRDMISHVIGTELMLLGESAPDVAVSGEHLKNPIGETNERWIEVRRGLPGIEVVAELRSVAARRVDVLRAMTQDEFDAPSWTPAGNATYGRFMRIRVFDCWMHEQDIRHALDRPGHESGAIVEMCLDEVVASLPFVVGKRAGAGSGQSVRFELTGPAPRRVDVVVGDRASIGVIDGEPTVTMTVDSGLFTRLVGGRTGASGAVERGAAAVAGNAELAGRLIAGLAYMI